MRQMFLGCVNFNQDISAWDVRNVEEMSNIFNGCINLNPNCFNLNFSKKAIGLTSDFKMVS